MFTISYETLLIITGVLLVLLLLAVIIIIVLWSKNGYLQVDKNIAELELKNLALQLDDKNELMRLQLEITAKK